MSDNIIRIKIDDQIHEVDVDEDTSIKDLDSDMRQIPGLIGWYGRLLATARAQAVVIDGEYRRWRAVVAMKSDGKAEHKIKTDIEATAKFSEWKKAIATIEETVVSLEKAYEALRVKADMLRSLGAMSREELRSTTVETKIDFDGSSLEERREEKKQQLRKKNRGEE